MSEGLKKQRLIIKFKQKSYVQGTYRRGGAQRAHVHATEHATLAFIERDHRGESRAL